MDTTQSLIRALEVLRAEIKRDVEAQTLIALLIVAKEGAVNMAELQRRLGLGSSAMSRNVGLLGDTGYRNGANQAPSNSLGLVTAREDPMDRRHKTVTITPKGRAVVAKALRSLEQATGA